MAFIMKFSRIRQIQAMKMVLDIFSLNYYKSLKINNIDIFYHFLL